MISKLKSLGLAFFAITAMSAVAASAAQAGSLDLGTSPANLHAHSEANQQHELILQKTGFQGQQLNRFPAKCPTAALAGTTQGQIVQEATVTATYSPNGVANCQAFGVMAQVLMNGCKYTVTGSGQPANTAVVDIVGCTAGKQIEIKTAICSLDVPELNGLPHVTGGNLTSQEVTVSAKVIDITVRQTGAACPDGNNHSGTNSEFVGNSIAKAYVDKENVQVTNHNHQYVETGKVTQTTLAST